MLSELLGLHHSELVRFGLLQFLPSLLLPCDCTHGSKGKPQIYPGTGFV